jgi:hypothetical protein
MSALILRELQRIADKPSLKQVLERIESRAPVTDGPSAAELIREDREHH